ncbi:MAG: hypothetical protein ACSLEN_14760 [Candidatus Malihini olakiniferum]
MIEITVDQGDVAVGELSEAILELEMEPKAGQTDDLLWRCHNNLRSGRDAAEKLE